MLNDGGRTRWKRTEPVLSAVVHLALLAGAATATYLYLHATIPAYEQDARSAASARYAGKNVSRPVDAATARRDANDHR